MLMPQFTNQRAKLDNVNVRAEKHGDENVVAVDLKITVEVGNEILDSFDPGLRPALYRKPNKNDAAELFDKTKDEAPMRVLRFPKLAPLRWDAEFPSCALKINYGVSGANDLNFTAAVDKFVMDNKDGGTTALSFRAVVKPDGEMDELCALIQSEISITLTQPTEMQQSLEQPPVKTTGKAIDGTK